MNEHPLTPLERQRIITPLGIRFWDAVLGCTVADGLLVMAWEHDRPSTTIQAQPTSAGVYAFHGLPGLREREYPVGDTALPSPPPARRYVVTVEDTQGRFLPMAFKLDAPFRGIFPLGSGSPPGPPGVYLFAASSRAPSADLAFLRADLIDRWSGAPAAHAVLTVTTPDGQEWYGISDMRGCVALALPYPRFQASGGSPPVLENPPRWMLDLRVAYHPAARQGLPRTNLPDLASILGQPAGLIWPTNGAAVGQQSYQLIFGQDLIVRTADTAGLWVGSAASP